MQDSVRSFSHAEQVLELPELLALVGGYAGSAAGRRRVLALRPHASAAAAAGGHALLAELAALSRDGNGLPQPAVPDLAETLGRAAPEGAVLPGEDLLPVRRFLEMCAGVTEFAAGHPEAVRLAAHVAGLDPVPDLLRRLRRALDDEGALADNASPRLAEIRHGTHVLEARIQRQLDELLARWNAAGVIQDAFVTLRNGRFVVPVKRDAKNRPAGVVHDHSDSGRTLFLEPAATLPLGNELADLKLEERDECRRILAELTAAVRLAAPVLGQNAGVLAELDAAAAAARWAADFDAVLPQFGRRLELRGARHPLLAHRFRAEGHSETLVPLDLALPEGTQVLLVSGPNSGGKTAALKTVGLLTLAAQAGLPVPVFPESRFLWIGTVEADIGDEQSLAADLSTFTGHLRRIGEILRHVEARAAASPTASGTAAPCPALVLLDEAGSGTDPLEGGALACAVLERLAAAGALALATTHLGSLKTFVHDRPGMLNAAVRFNPDTLRPEFALDLGAPGSSRALTIAARAGFPETVLGRAKELLSSDYLRLESMLAHIEESQRETARKEREVREAAGALADEREQVRTALAELRRDRRRLLHEAHVQADGIVENTRREMDRLLHEARVAELGGARVARTESVKAEVEEKQRKLAAGKAATGPRPPAPLPPRELTPGRNVWVEKLQANARITAVDDGGRTVEVELGAARYRLAARDVGRRDTSVPEERPAPMMEHRPRSEDACPSELLLLGKRVDEALDLLDRFLDRAALGGLPEVRIVHGFGTGRLQTAVHDHLRGHPLVLRHRLGRGGADPGGGGVTLVELRRL